jgi:hypothetical protein
MIRAAFPVMLIALLFSTGGSPMDAQSSVINPVGSYTVTSTDDTGTPLAGTLTIRATDGGYTGEFVSGETLVPFVQVTTNGTHMMAVIDLTDYLAVTWLQLQEDGSFSGTWHQMSPGIAVTAKKN